jgi:hypothetical protein
MIEYTDRPDDLPTVEEGKAMEEEDTTSTGAETTTFVPPTHGETAASNESDSDDSTTPWDMLHSQSPPDPELFVMDNSESLRRSTRVRRPNFKYVNIAKAVEWANSCEDKALVEACAREAHPIIIPSTLDANSWEPAPRTIRDIIRLPSRIVKSEWLKSVKNELKTLIDSGTFAFDRMEKGETSTPIMETFKVKVKSNGTLDKLKT